MIMGKLKKLQWSIENLVMILIKYLEMNQILALDKPIRS